MKLDQALDAEAGGVEPVRPPSARAAAPKVPVRVCLHQPNFLPWAKLIDKIMACDVYIAYDSVQYTRTEFHSRQQIGSRDGPVWLSVPVLTRGRGRQRLCEVELVPGGAWRDAHLRLLREHYGRAPRYNEVSDLIATVYAQGDGRLVDLNLALIEAILAYVGASVQIVRATAYPHEGSNTERLIQLTRAVGADTHVTSTFGTDRQYISWEEVADAGIVVEAQRFEEPTVEWVHPHVPGLSIVDLLFVVGSDAGRILTQTRSLEPVLGVTRS
ncbi:MAG TPA: WbqC family protein [Dermatophilaceae bacterium]|nr:WbqC family protein [Dermatophilaceae bacterium]